MAVDWAEDIRKYAPGADDGVIAGIVRYCGIALQKRDSSLVSFSDAKETSRIRQNFLKKKLGLIQPDDVLDKAIAKVGDRMKADRTKNRVTVYYLLADAFDSLGLFAGKSAAGKSAKAKPAARTTKAAATTVAAPTPGIATKTSAKSKAAAAPAKVPPTPAVTPKTPAKGNAAAKPVKAAAKTKPPVAAASAKILPAKGKAAAAPVKAAATTKPLVTTASAKKAPAKSKTAQGTGAAGGATALSLASLGDRANAPKAAAKPPQAPSPPPSVPKSAAASAAASSASAAAPAGSAAAPVARAAPAAASSSPPAPRVIDTGPTGAATPTVASADEGSGLGWVMWLLLALLAAFIIWWAFLRSPGTAVSSAEGSDQAVPAASVDAGSVDAISGAPASPAAIASSAVAATPAEGSAAIPAGAGVTSEMRNGKPVVKVYFDTGKTALAPAFAEAAAGLKDYLDGDSQRSLAVSGYNDATGNAAANAELSKNRAQAVAAALVAAGIPQTSVALVKPQQATDASVSGDAARRVEVIVR